LFQSRQIAASDMQDWPSLLLDFGYYSVLDIKRYFKPDLARPL